MKPFLHLALCFLALSVVSTPAATLIWTNTAGGNWTNAANWSPNLVPTLADTAIITNEGPYTVTVSSAASAGNILMGLADANSPTLRTLGITNGSLTVTNATFETNAAVQFNGGTLTVHGGVNVKGAFTWTAGTLAGAGTFEAGANGPVTISGPGAKSLSQIDFRTFSSSAT